HGCAPSRGGASARRAGARGGARSCWGAGGEKGKRGLPEGGPIKAAVSHGAQKPLTIEQVEIDKPIGREMLVRTVASGVCHSDLHFVDGFYPFPTPAILGHEAAGI